MINHREWFAARRKLLRSVKAEVRLRLGPVPKALREYARAITDAQGVWYTARAKLG